jgi:hypothetical protein
MTKAKISKPEEVKLPDTVYIVNDVFIDIDFHTNKPVGFFYNKDEAEKFRTGHQEEMTKGVAMFNYHQNKYFDCEDEKDIELHEQKMYEHSYFEDYDKSIIEEVKLIK